MELGHITDHALTEEKGQFKKWIIACPPWANLQKKHAQMMEAKAKKEKGLVDNQDSDDSH